jgi:gliding motility-associated-like protein
MKYSRLFLFLASFAGLINSGICQTADVTQGCAPLTVNFSGPGNVTNYYWDFKDGSTSNLKNPTNIFTKAGTYNVTFQETPTGAVIKTITIQVYASPSLSIKTGTGCAPVAVTLASTSTFNAAISVSNYTWTFGDGQTAQSSAPSVSHTYTGIGPWNVTLNIHTNFPSCDQTKVFTGAVSLLTAPVAAFTTNPANTVTCKDTLDVIYTDATTHTQALTYAWNFGNGKTSTVQNPPSQRYFSGNYTATLTASYKGIVGCTTSTSKTLTVGRPPVTMQVLKDTICIYDQATVSTTTPGTYLWNIGPNASAPQLNQSSVVISYTSPGLHTVKLSVTTPDGQCTDTKSVQIYVDEVTAAITPPGPVNTCQSPDNINYIAVSNQSSANLLYNWHIYRIGPPSYNGKLLPDIIIKNVSSVSQKYISDLDSIYYSKNALENYQADLTITSKITGCHASASSLLNMWLANAQFKTNITKGCKPLTVTFTDSSSTDKFTSWTSPVTNNITSWKWVFGDGQTQTNLTKTPFQHVYADTGVYNPYLVITTEHGCTDTSYAIEITVGMSLTTVDFTSDKVSVCPGDSIHLSVVNPSPFVDAYHFVTDNNKVFHCGDDQTAAWAYNDVTGLQDVSLMLDNNGCYSTITKTNFITVKGAIAKLDYYALCNKPMEYHFTSKSISATSVSWDFGDGQTSTLNTVAHTYAAVGNYTVVLTASGAGGCPATTDTAFIKVRQVKAKMIIDTLLCINSPYTFDASGSTGTEAFSACDYSYTWQFPDLPLMRPYTTPSSTAPFTFNTNGVHKVRLIAKDVNGCRDTTTKKIKVFNITVLPPTVDKTDICTPTIVTLKDNSVGDTTLVKWEWNFGDSLIDTVSFSQNSFTHTFKNPPLNGSFYDVSWVVTDALGCKTDLPIQPKPHTTINYYKPVSSITASPRPNMCIGDSVILSASPFSRNGSHLSYAWDLGNGNTSTLQTIPSIKYPVGNYTVKLIYTETSTGCNDSTTQVISVQSYPKAEIFTADPKNPSVNLDSVSVFCAPQQLIFTDTTNQAPFATTRSWFFSGQPAPNPNNLKSYSYGYNKGTYTVTLIDQTSNGCADTAVRKFDALRAQGTFTVTPKQLCRYDTISVKLNSDTINVSSYKWFFEGVEKDNQPSPKFAANSGHHGWTLVNLELFEKQCANTVTDSVFINEIVADFTRLDTIGLDSAICLLPSQGYKLFDASDIKPPGPYTFSWDFGDGSTSTVNDNPVHNYKASGIYNVTLAISNGTCKDTIRKAAVINPNPKVKGIGDTVCVGNVLHLQVDTPDATASYLWSPGTGLADSTATSITVNLPHTLGYLLKETDSNGCTDSTIVSGIVIEHAPFPDNWDTTIVIGDYATLPVYGHPVYNFSWTPTDSLSCLNCNYPKAHPLKDITYNLLVSDVRNCFTDPKTFTVKVHPETFLILPTAFTPNADGSNDILYVNGWGIKELKIFQIFNRWGQLIYSSNDITQGWDGKYNGTVQNEDVYVYKVTGIDWKDQEKHLEGYVNLLH